MNMAFMVVTLEVSKLSGWLSADARCRESKGGHTVRGEVRPAGGGRGDGRPRGGRGREGPSGCRRECGGF